MARRPRPWFRFYVEAVHDRKLRRLKPEHRWLFVACLAAARQSPTPGVLLIGDDDPMTLDDLADFAGMSTPSVRAGLAQLLKVAVLRQEGEIYSVPAWNERQFESDDVTARTAKHRSKERDGNVPRTAEGTPPESESDTESESVSLTTPAEADPIVVEAKRRTTIAAAGGRVRDPDAYELRVIASLRAEGWEPPRPPVAPIPDADGVLAYIRRSAEESAPMPEGLNDPTTWKRGAG